MRRVKKCEIENQETKTGQEKKHFSRIPKGFGTILLTLALVASSGALLTACGEDSDAKGPKGMPPGAVSGGAAGFDFDGEKPDFEDGEMPEPPEGFNGEKPEMPEDWNGEKPDFSDGERPEPPEGRDGEKAENTES